MGWFIFFLWCVAAAATGAWVGWKVKGRPLTGFVLGVFLGWVGVGITALLPPTAEMRVQRRLRDDAINAEARRRQMGHQPWGYPDPPPWAGSSRVTSDQLAPGVVVPKPEHGSGETYR